MVKIRLTRFGRKNRPFFRIIVQESATRRDGKYIENLGWYDPLQEEPTKKISFNKQSYKEWVKKGAQPSNTVVRLLKHAKIGI
ncbi:MAG: 30S ribosomal protein S16 [Planctomycetes bacterium]|nr:30S ribosomal protein S16 [Planctomycetota bacterium]